MSLEAYIAKAKAKAVTQRSVLLMELQPMPPNLNPARATRKPQTSTSGSRQKPKEAHSRSADVEELMKTIQHQKVFIQNLQNELSGWEERSQASASVTVSQPVVIMFDEGGIQSEPVEVDDPLNQSQENASNESNHLETNENENEVNDPLVLADEPPNNESIESNDPAEISESDDNVPLSQLATPQTTRISKKTNTKRTSTKCEYCFKDFTSAKHVRDHIKGE